MSNNDLDIDNLLDNESIFKPLTDGLGFHHSIKEKKEVKSTLEKQKVVLKEQLETRAKEINRRANSNLSNKETKVSMGELAPFYGEGQAVKVKPLKVETLVSTVEEANLIIRFGAWFIDIVVIASVVTLSIAAIIFISEIPLSYISENTFQADIISSLLAISLLFYAFYFSFFDKTNFSTPGKRLCGLRVVTIKEKPISFIQAFSRVFITMISSFTLGLGCLLRVQDKLTDTMVINK